MSMPKGTRKNDKTRELQNAWQKENQLTIACKIDKRTGQAFRDYATANNTTVSALVAGFVRSTLDAAGMLPNPKSPADPVQDDGPGAD